jgi:type IV pilus assembly protein PilC
MPPWTDAGVSAWCWFIPEHSMPNYTYKAHDTRNRLIAGTMEGASVDAVVESLTGRNLLPIAVDEMNFDGSARNEKFSEKIAANLKRFQGRVPYKTVVFFTRQFATMIAGGVPLARALEQLAGAEKTAFRTIINQIKDDISIGYSFSDAIARHPGVFNSMFISIIRSGEMAGALDAVLDQLATYMENVEAMRAKVKAAMRYPMFIGGFVIILIIGILWKLVPIFEGMYSGFGATLPAPTLMLVAVSHFFRDNLLPLGVIIVLGAIGYQVGMANDRFKTGIHALTLRIPVFGGILTKNILAVFSRTMALLLESGTPILQAIEIAGGVVNNKVYAKAIEHVYRRLQQGDLLSAALAGSGRFPALVQQLVATGEESGKVGDLLRKAAEFYEREIKNVVDSLAAIIEPFLIMFLGGIVGSILVALYLPIFSIGKLMGAH